MFIEIIIVEKDDKIKDSVDKLKEMGATIETLQKILSDTSRELQKHINYIVKRKEDTHTNDDKIATIERKLDILEKRRIGSKFCEYCEKEFKSGCEEKTLLFIVEKPILFNAMSPI